MGIKKGVKSLVLLLFISSILLLPAVGSAAGEKKLSIMQIDSNLPELNLYLRLDNVEMDYAKLKENLKVNLDGAQGQIIDIQPVKNESGVTATSYLFLVDTSRSMKMYPGQLRQLQTLLELLLTKVGPNDQAAVLGFSDGIETLKDFNVPMNEQNSPQNIAQNIVNSISSDNDKGTYLYQGIQKAIVKSRTTNDLPQRHIVVIIYDCDGVYGDSIDQADIKKTVDVDRVPVYSLILNNANRVDKTTANALEDIAQRTGAQIFINSNGQTLFSQFESSVDSSSLVKMRFDNYQPGNQQAIISAALIAEKELSQSAKFTPKLSSVVPPAVQTQPGEEKSSQAESKEPEKKAFQLGLQGILIAGAALLLVILLVLVILIFKARGRKRQVVAKTISTTPVVPRVSGPVMILQSPAKFSGMISLQLLSGPNNGKVIELQAGQDHRIGSTPECSVRVDAGSKIYGIISALDDMVVVQSQAPGELFVNGTAVAGSHILQNGDLVRVPQLIFKIIM